MCTMGERSTGRSCLYSRHYFNHFTVDWGMLCRAWHNGRRGPLAVVGRRWIQTETTIAELGLKLPDISAPKGNYMSYQQTGNLVYLSGHLPIPADGQMITGRLGENMTTDEGYEASKIIGLQLLATMKLHLGDLDRISKVVKLFGVVNSTNDFTEQAKVSLNFLSCA